MVRGDAEGDEAKSDQRFTRFLDSIQMLSCRPRRVVKGELVGDRIRGMFVALEVDWGAVAKSFREKGYAVKPDSTGKELSIPRLSAMFPIHNLTKDFPPYCRAKVELKTSLLSTEEVRGYVPQFLRERKAPQESGAVVLKWLEEKEVSSKGTFIPGFHDVVEFKIEVFLGVKHLLAQSGAPDDAKVQKLTRSVEELLELVGEKLVYKDLWEGFGYNEISRSKLSPFVHCVPYREDLEITVQMPENEKIRLGQTFMRNASIKDSKNRTLKFGCDKKSPVMVLGEDTDSEKSYETRIRSAEGDPFEVELVDKCDTPQGNTSSTTLRLIFKPKIDLLKKGAMPRRPRVTIQLVHTITDIVMAEETKEFPLQEPDLRVDVKGPLWTHKGADVTLRLSYHLGPPEELYQDGVEIPVTVTMLTWPAVDNIDPSSDEAKKFQLMFTRKPKDRCLMFKPKRADRLRVYFRFASSDQNAVWQLHGYPFTTYALPSLWPDTLAFLVPLSLQLAQLFYPNIVPQLAPELNLNTLTSGGTLLFLAYRYFDWTRALSEKQDG